MTPDDLRAEPGWADRSCQDQHHDEFHRVDGEHWRDARTRLTAAAQHYCRPCPIRDACRRAGQHAGGWGLWGGAVHSTHNGEITTIDLLDTDRQANRGQQQNGAH